jgi:hypothetical protein
MTKQETAASIDDMVHLFLDLAPHIQITEHTPGKIVMRFGLGSLAALQNTHIGDIDRMIPGIRRTKTNLWRRSIVIEYDENQISPELWESLAAGATDPDQREVLKKRLTRLLTG